MRFCVENMSFGRPNEVSSVVDLDVSVSVGIGIARGGDSATAAYSRCSITIQAIESRAELAGLSWDDLG